MKMLRKFALGAAVLSVTCAMAQEPAQPEQGPGGTRAEVREQPPVEPKPYEKVITADAKTKKGVFVVHQVKEKWYFEIPKSELSREFLWLSRMAGTAIGIDKAQSYGHRIVRWEVIKNKVLLREVRYGPTSSDPNSPIVKGIQATNVSPIIVAFNVEAWSKDGSPVIDVTRFLANNSSEISIKRFVSRGNLDPNRSYVERVSVFPENIEMEATNTFVDPPSTNPNSAFAFFGGSTTVIAHYSMIRLPEKPMRQRLFDDRVGYFTLNQGDFGTNQHKLVSRAYIARWRLEKKDPTAAISEPIKPIVFYVDPATPKKWVPYIKKAVENWQPAFEEAGFKNAIIAKEAPSPEVDPEWSIEDARYSVIHWVPAGIENAFGPHISDRRSGEILNAPVAVYHNIMNLQRAWYFLQVGALDPRAQKFPLPDDLMGKLIEYVVTHEVGHSLGLRHNFKASSLYTLEQIRNREWVKKMGHTPSIMDYARFNYVAQPEDKIDVDDLTPKIGPYDKWAIKWGYAPLPQVQTADEEKPLLDQWAQEQEAKPWLRFADDKAAQGADPGEETEAVGDADAVAATALGVKNLERVSKLLFSATTTEKGAPYSDLREMYGRMVRQWTMEMNHVARIPGGATTTNRHVGQEGMVYTPWSRDRQVAAVKFLSENAFQTPKFFLDTNVLRRIEPSGFIVTINKAQSTILKNLLATDKLTRMEEWVDTDGKAYSPVDFLADVRKGVFKELEGTGPIKIDAMRRSLQQSYVYTMANNLGGVQRPYFRGELVALNNKIKASTARAGDSVTREHLDDIKDQIAKALDPKFAPPAPPTRHRMAFSDSEDMLDFTECWPE